MPSYRELPQDLRVTLTSLFTPANFCFVTSEVGRTPTFYFAKGGLPCISTATSCGRIRTMHGSGPLIDITSVRKRHFFFRLLADRQTVRHAMSRMSDQQLTNGDARFFMDLVAAVYGAAPRDGDYHYEYTVPNGQPNHVTRRHPSGGQISLSPRITQQQLIKLIDRVLTDNGAVEVDRQNRVRLGAAVNRNAVNGVGAYLNSL